MAYADQQMSGSKITALVIVALVHIFVGYALVTGLAYEAAKKVVKTVTTVDIKEPEPPKEEPPPPEPEPEQVPQDTAPPPPVAPPVKINVSTKPPQIDTVQTPPPPAPVIAIAAPPAPVVAPPAPPAPKGPTKGASPKGNPGRWATNDDYPSRAMRDGAQGVTGFRVTVGTNGRVTDCTVTSSSGSSELDEATCKLISRRARFEPAVRNGEEVEGTYSNRITWRIPD